MYARRSTKSATAKSAASRKRRPVSRQPARRRVSGRGGYWYVGGQGSAALKLGKLGSASIGVQGGYANRQVSRQVVSGKGAYQIKRNVLYEGAAIPEMYNARRDDGAVVIRHSEYICDVISSSTAGAFANQSFPLNPGLAQTFEYLAQLAANFTEYRIEGMLIEFRTRSVDALNSTNTALGSVYIATQYNSLEPDFSSKAEMSSYQYCNNCKPSESMIHIIECDPKQTAIEHLYIRTGAVPSSADIRLYDLGRLQIATQGMQAASVNIGELHVTYQVALYKPRLYESLGHLNDSQVLYSTSVSISPSNICGVGALSASPNANFTYVTNNIPLSSGSGYTMITNGSTGTMRLYAPRYPMGVRLMYRIIWSWSAAKTQDATAPTLALLAGTSGATDLTAAYFGNAYSTPLPTVSSSVWTLNAVVDFQYAVNPVMVVTYNGTFPTDATCGVYITVTQIPNDS